MTLKEKFLAIESYEEFDKRREEFKSLKMSDKDVLEHVAKIFPKPSNTKEELYKSPHSNTRRIIGQ